MKRQSPESATSVAADAGAADGVSAGHRTPTVANATGPHDDPVPADLRAVVDLFSHDLREVIFPGVDAAVLRRHADEVRARARDVDRARAALDAALAAFDERTAALAGVAARALAYARIYAADQPDLAARLAEIEGPRGAPAPPPPRRGRRPAPRPQLPLEGRDETVSDATTPPF